MLVAPLRASLRVSIALGLEILLSTILLTALPGNVTAEAGTYSGSTSVNYSFEGGSVTGGGHWSLTVDNSGHLTGGSSFQMTISLPPSEGCEFSPSSLTLSEKETWTGVVQGTVATITESGSISTSTGSVTLTCSSNGQSYSQSIPFSFPSTFSNQEFTMDLSQLEKGGQATTSVGGVDETFSLTSGPSPVTTLQPPATTTSKRTTTQSAPSTNTSGAATASTDCHVVNPTEHIDICVPDWLSGSSSGSATVTGAGGTPQTFTGTLPIGDTLQTGSESLATVSDDGTTVTEGPDSQMTDNGCTVDQSGTFYCYPESTALEINGVVKDALSKALEGNTVAALWTFGKGIYNAEVNLLNQIQNNVVPCLMSPNTVVVHQSGSDATMTVTDNGTQLDVLSGTWVAIGLESGQSVTLAAGEQLFVPSNSNQAAQENLSASVQSFNPGSLTQWWSQKSQPPSSWFSGSTAYVITALVLVALVVVAATYAIRRSQRETSQEAFPAQLFAPSPALQAGGGFCRVCGSPIYPQAAFCMQCGARLT